MADNMDGGPVEVSGQDELLEIAREAGLPVQEATKHVGKCRHPECDEELPDNGPKTMNLGVEDGYCGLACRLDHEDSR